MRVDTLHSRRLNSDTPARARSDVALPTLAVIGLTVAGVLGLQLIIVLLGYLLWKLLRKGARSRVEHGPEPASGAALEPVRSLASGRASFLARWLGANADERVFYSPVSSRSAAADATRAPREGCGAFSSSARRALMRRSS